jgi:hypothetical protein
MTYECHVLEDIIDDGVYIDASPSFAKEKRDDANISRRHSSHGLQIS